MIGQTVECSDAPARNNSTVISAGQAGNGSVAVVDRSRVKRIGFNDYMDVVLLKSVQAVNAHIAERGTLQQNFEEPVKGFMANVTLDMGVTPPTWKTI